MFTCFLGWLSPPSLHLRLYTLQLYCIPTYHPSCVNLQCQPLCEAECLFLWPPHRGFSRDTGLSPNWIRLFLHVTGIGTKAWMSISLGCLIPSVVSQPSDNPLASSMTMPTDKHRIKCPVIIPARKWDRLGGQDERSWERHLVDPSAHPTAD